MMISLWGKLLSTTGSMASTVGKVNPFLYRGYCYDSETGLYYLNSRYYDPETGRFLNADAFAQTRQNLIGTNMFAYCYNNPINSSDSSGYMAAEAAVAITNLWNTVGWIAATVFTIEVVVIVAMATDVVQMSRESKKSNKEKSTDKPSWVNKGMVNPSLPAEENARRILNTKYGKGGWEKGPGSEFNKVKKWLVRDMGLRQVINNQTDNKISAADMTTARFLAGSYVINDVSKHYYGWVDGNYHSIPLLYNLF